MAFGWWFLECVEEYIERQKEEVQQQYVRIRRRKRFLRLTKAKETNQRTHKITKNVKEKIPSVLVPCEIPSGHNNSTMYTASFFVPHTPLPPFAESLLSGVTLLLSLLCVVIMLYWYSRNLLLTGGGRIVRKENTSYYCFKQDGKTSSR